MGGLTATPSHNQLQSQQQHLIPVVGQPPASAGSGRASLPAGAGGGSSSSISGGATERQHGGRGGQIAEYGYSHALRCVHFPPSGQHIIVGGANPAQNPRSGGMGGGGMTFSLRLFDFDLDAALHPRGIGRQPSGDEGSGEKRRAINNVCSSASMIICFFLFIVLFCCAYFVLSMSHPDSSPLLHLPVVCLLFSITVTSSDRSRSPLQRWRL